MNSNKIQTSKQNKINQPTNGINIINIPQNKSPWNEQTQQHDRNKPNKPMNKTIGYIARPLKLWEENRWSRRPTQSQNIKAMQTKQQQQQQ